ncbi:unnamed protein product [Durusdinium trenchii]|uniref:Uncharacterized protein n=1 Tax=Durusdinium trenchii TaxID=1381693 RepID=A0ABP0H7U1_9DINO
MAWRRRPHARLGQEEVEKYETASDQAVEPEMKISIVRVKAQPRKHKVISYGYRKLIDGEVPEMYRFQYLPDPDLPEDLHPGVIPAGFSACVPVDQDMVYFHTREGDTGPEYQVVCADPDDVLRADGRVDRASELDSISTLVS